MSSDKSGIVIGVHSRSLLFYVSDALNGRIFIEWKHTEPTAYIAQSVEHQTFEQHLMSEASEGLGFESPCGLAILFLN